MNDAPDPAKDGRIMHVDTSCRFYEKRNTGIAFKIVKTGEHKGLILTNKLKRELDKKLHTHRDYARLYAICIYYLIRDSFNMFDVLVICGDEKFDKVKVFLDYLFQHEYLYQKDKIVSIGELREITGDKKLRSYADGVANIYRRKASKPPYRKQRGIPLNIVPLTYAAIAEKWEELNQEFKKV